jgi:hypothetical protein
LLSNVFKINQTIPVISMSERRSKRIKQEVAADDMKVPVDQHETKDDATENLDNYEQIRQENIQRNLQFLNSIGIQDVKSDLHVLTTSSSSGGSSKPVARGLSTKRKASQRTSLPPRRSGRVTIERLKKEIDDTVASGSADVTLLDQKRSALEVMVAEKAASTFVPANLEEYPADARNADPVSLLTPLNQPKSTAEEEEGEEEQCLDWGHGLLPLLRAWLPSSSSSSTSSLKEEEMGEKGEEEGACAAYRAGIGALQVVETDVAKVVPQRITAMIMHPVQDRTLVIAGDKQGVCFALTIITTSVTMTSIRTYT